MITASSYSQSLSRTTESLGADLTAMLDILFILLVFFILTTGVSFRALELQLPEASAPQALEPQDEQVVLEVRSSSYALDGEPVTTLEALKEKILIQRDEYEDMQVVIAGEKTASLQRFIEVLTMLQDSQIKTADILLKEHA